MKIAPIAIFIFILVSVYYLGMLNDKYEQEIQAKM